MNDRISVGAYYRWRLTTPERAAERGWLVDPDVQPRWLGRYVFALVPVRAHQRRRST